MRGQIEEPVDSFALIKTMTFNGMTNLMWNTHRPHTSTVSVCVCFVWPTVVVANLASFSMRVASNQLTHGTKPIHPISVDILDSECMNCRSLARQNIDGI